MTVFILLLLCFAVMPILVAVAITFLPSRALIFLEDLLLKKRPQVPTGEAHPPVPRAPDELSGPND